MQSDITMAFNDTTAIWMPTKFSDFNFSDCKLGASWGALVYTTFDFPLNETEILLRNALGDFWRSNLIPQPNQIELLSWFMNATSSGQEPSAQGPQVELLSAIIQSNTWDCLADFCKKLPWQGNSDLTGRGVSASLCPPCQLLTLRSVR